MPVTLGFMLGFRRALIPYKASHKTKINRDNIQKVAYAEHASTGGHPRALAIAAYRACKNEATLKKQRTISRVF